MIYKLQRYYDVVIEGVDAATGVATMLMPNGQLYDCPDASPYWTPGQRGVWECTTSAVQFWAYADQSLRRQPRLDRKHRQLGELWAWSSSGVKDVILTKPHFVPGMDGRYIADLCEPLELAIPPEMVELCQNRGLTVEQVLRGFVADLCALQSSAVLPREDGYGSSSLVGQVKAMTWLNQSFPCPGELLADEGLDEGGV